MPAGKYPRRHPRRHPKLTPEENEHRMQLWRQGLTDSQMAKVLKLNPGTIASWRKARRLASNSDGGKELGWDLCKGDWIEVRKQRAVGKGFVEKTWHKGMVLRVYPRFAVVQLPGYRITVAKWELRCGEVEVRKLERKAG